MESWQLYFAGVFLLLLSPFAVFVFAKLASYGWRLGEYRFRRDQEKGKFDGP